MLECLLEKKDIIDIFGKIIWEISVEIYYNM